MANEEGEDLASRSSKWSYLLKEATFTQAAAALQGTIQGGIVADSDFDYYLNGTMWNRTTDLPIIGPLTPQEWQARQAFPIAGPGQQFKIEQGKLYFSPNGANATDTIAFHYRTKAWCESSGGTGQTEWLADTDVGRLDEGLMRLGLIWRWKKQKGLEYAEDFNTYERRVLNAIARDGGAKTLSLDTNTSRYAAGIIIPIGSWTP